jgi:hypothetical protein
VSARRGDDTGGNERLSTPTCKYISPLNNAAQLRSTLVNDWASHARVSAACQFTSRCHLVGMQTVREPLATSCATSRSKVSNGTRLLQNVDGRSSSARRFRDLVRAFEGEFNGNLTEVDRGQIRQAAALGLRAEQLQAAIVRGETVDDDHLVRISGESRRIVDGLKAKAAKRNSPSADEDELDRYLEQKAAAAR